MNGWVLVLTGQWSVTVPGNDSHCRGDSTQQVVVGWWRWGDVDGTQVWTQSVCPAHVCRTQLQEADCLPAL